MKEKYHNRLIHEKSPYLLQHADNPVDWYPWGEEAFAKASKEDKPVFLSIGYSTCHWCHVMEHESFEDPQIAKIINDYFVPIKVDREERPDIDSIYMAVVMAMTGRGGWPLTVILTPDKKPFFGGTYFPPQAKWGSPGLIDIMHSIHEAWQTQRAEIVQSSITFTVMLKERMQEEKGKTQLNEAVLTAGFEQLEQMYDETFGGFGHAPKFPTSHNLSFLLRYGHRKNDPKAFKMVEHTLVQMANGGMYDHIAGGFHRYSTDRQWQIPHFEKMLYDQAMLAKTYLEAYQMTHKPFYAQIAREIFDYVIQDMQHTEGGFFSAEDADSLDPESGEKKEGAYYLWRYEEIMNILGQQDSEIFNFHFGVKPNGNAQTDPHGEFIGKNIIYVNSGLENTATHFGKTVSDIQAVIQRSKERLFAYRKGRPRPHLDDKILTDWNGLMISSLAYGSRVLREPRYKEAAEKSAQFILKHLVNKKGRLLHRYRDGEAAIVGTIEDYAFFIHGLLDLYESTFQTEYLKEAFRLANDMLHLFWDSAEGGFYFTAEDAEELLFRQKEIYDGAIPSGNSLAALDLARLYHVSFQKRWEEKLEGLFDAFSLKIRSTPSAYAQMLIALDFAIGPSQEIVLASTNGDVGLDAILEEIYGRFLSNKVVLLRPVSGKAAGDIVAIAPFVDNQRPVNGQTTVYVCEDHVCKFPVSEIAQVREILDGLKPVR